MIWLHFVTFTKVYLYGTSCWLRCRNPGSAEMMRLIAARDPSPQHGFYSYCSAYWTCPLSCKQLRYETLQFLKRKSDIWKALQKWTYSDSFVNETA
jgi:hypothetical protein